MGKGKRNANQAPMGDVVACVSCGSALQPDWATCPYCGAQQPEHDMASTSMGAPPPVMAGGDDDPQEKTQAIDVSALQGLNERRQLVGWLVATNGNHRGEDFRIFDGKNLLGTAADCDMVITDPYLSAKHCTIRHENGNFVLIDLDSTNGTFVNQKRVSKMELIDNDTVRLGRTEFKFKSLY